SEYPGCGGHAEWANLPCQTQPAAQPEDTSLPKLPITAITYNIWNEPEKTTSTSGSATRTTTFTYDGAGRPLTKEETSTTGTALPKISYEYNSETGTPIKQSTTVEGKTKTITNTYNALGQLTSYTDADENTATYKYDIDGRPEETNDGKGTQTYTYDTTTGLPTKLLDSANGGITFTASYDPEGKLTSEGYPNGMSAKHIYNSVNETTGLEYEKTTHCTENCIWLKDTAVPSIHGQLLSQTSTLSSESYTYDAATRLTQVQETPAGKGCTTRIYAYDEETNRRSLTSREPGSEGKCATEGGTVERHTYDEANRLTDEGTAYDAFGDITTLPAPDAGGHELTSTYFVDGQLASQTQNAQTLSYKLDPAQRTREITTGSTEILEHYSSETDSPTWSKNLATSTTTRYIPGIGSGLAAIQTNSEAPILQLADLHGDIIATASLSETATKLLTTENSTEYGVPTTSTPARYSWLGSAQRPTELPSGVIAMGARSYIPQLGRFLQPDPQPGGSANAYAYTNGDPINSSDPSGKWTLNETSGGLSAVGSGTGENLPGGVGVAPGAVMPPPVNQQIEEGGEDTLAGGPSQPGDVARAAFNHTWTVEPSTAFMMGFTIGVFGADASQAGHWLGLMHIPGFAIQGVDHMMHGTLQQFGRNLTEAGLFAVRGTAVEIRLYGSLRYGVDFEITYFDARNDDGDE
ncbi:MAG: RHS repeat-associated core domain-containing protein, partial [Solirubrobacteraceae bacterium]